MRIPAFLSVMLLAAIPPTCASAQDQFGAAVRLSGDDILVMKPAPGHGPSGVYVFTARGPGFERTARLFPEALQRTGESFGRSFTVRGGLLVVGAGDPATAFAGEVFRLDGAQWRRVTKLALSADAGDRTVVPDEFDFASLLRIMQPARRTVAFDGTHVVAAVTGSDPALKIFTRQGDGWRLPTAAPLPDGAARSGFGWAVATNGSAIAVGAPLTDPAGAVYIYEPAGGGSGWELRVTVEPEDLPPGAHLGAALAFDGEKLLAGAPGTAGASAGRIVEIARGAGTWSVTGELAPGESGAGDLFGISLAVSGDRMLVGAPGADKLSGRVFAFERSENGWTQSAVINPEDAEPGAVFGTSVAINARLAAVGAPGTHGSTGAVAVYRYSGNTFTRAATLTAGGELNAVTGGATRCTGGDAAQFSCGNVDLLSFLPIGDIGGEVGESLSDIWGWTDPVTGKEYALVGRTNGAAFVDISDPANPHYLGVLPAGATGTRDIKTYKNFAFVTGESRPPHGMLVFDLTRLRDVTDAPVTFEPDAHYDQVANAHNLVINTESGFAFTVGNSGGGQTCGGGLHMIDIRDPLNPTFAGCYTDTEGLVWKGRTHDAQCVIYHGPDTEHRGKEICLASNETALRVVDVTDKSNPIPLAAAEYPGIGYVHQGWLTDDQRYFYLDDELDELIHRTDKTRTMVWDMSDLDDPLLVAQYYGPNSSTDHNLYIKGNLMYQANYQAGFRVIDIEDREHPVEVGYFDTTPYEGDPPGFGGGAWTAYPFFKSGTVIVSSIHEGLFVLKPRIQKPVP